MGIGNILTWLFAMAGTALGLVMLGGFLLLMGLFAGAMAGDLLFTVWQRIVPPRDPHKRWVIEENQRIRQVLRDMDRAEACAR